MQLTSNIYLCGSGALGLSPKGDCHTYAIRGGEDIALVDCGMSRDPQAIVANLERDGLDPSRVKYILLTHAHPDHVGGCEYFREHYQTKILCSAYEAEVLSTGPVAYFHLDGDDPALKMWKDMPALVPDAILGDHEAVCLDSVRILANLTPGHTKGSLCYEVDIGGEIGLFTGDTVFYNGFISILSPPFSYYDGYRDALLSLRDKKADGLYPSHLMWTTRGGQQHIDMAIARCLSFNLPFIKPFS